MRNADRISAPSHPAGSLDPVPPTVLILLLFSVQMVNSLTPHLNCNLLVFPQLTFSSINCNSLNMSTMSSFHQKQKIFAISKLNTDFIFLSNIRLGNNTRETCIPELERLLLLNPHSGYKLFHNSKKNSRGVGILIKHDLTVLVLSEAEDVNDTILALHCSYNDVEFVIVSIYGPNKSCERFFPDLVKILNTVSHLPIILAGDWNCTVSTDPVNSNTDCFNMKALPNLSHSRLLKSLTEKFSLLDPYRCYYPDRKDYTFVPRDGTKTN